MQISKLVIIALLFLSPLFEASAGLEDLSRITQEVSQRASSNADPWQTSNADARPIEPGQTLTLADLKGPGEVRHIWFTIAADDAQYPQSLVLRAYYDGRSQPGIESPLGDFFGVGHGMLKAYQSAPIEISSDGRAYNCFWRMPFEKSMKLEVTNESDKRVNAFYYYVDWVSMPALPHNTAYFHAQYRQEKPCESGKNYLLLDTEGSGNYVGTVLSVFHAEPSWFGEGDDFFYIDGSPEPVLRGTGSEDYFCDAWGFREFQQMNHGLTIWEGYETGSRATAYRWHIQDPIRFSKSIRVEIEHMGARVNPDGSVVSGFIERADDYASVAYWYQTGEPKRFAEVPPLEKRLRKKMVIQAESAMDSIVHSTGPVTIQDGDQWNGKKQVLFSPPAVGATLSIPFEVKESTKAICRLLLTKSFDYGTYEISIEGEPPLATVDLYAPSVEAKQILLKKGQIEAGTYKINFKAVGSNPKSKLFNTETPGYFLGIDGIELMELP